MKYFIVFLFLAGFSGSVFAQNLGDTQGDMWLPACLTESKTGCDRSSLFHDAISRPFTQSDSVAVGTIIQKEKQEQNSIKYSINVDFYLKNYQPFDLLTATLNNATEPQTFPEVLYYNSPVFNEGDLVFVYLKKSDGQYNVLSESFALDKQEARGPPPIILLTKSPSEDDFKQGDIILVSGEIRKMELVKAVKDGEQLDAKLALYDENNQVIFSDLIDIDVDGSYNYGFQTSTIPPGKYELRVNYGSYTTGDQITIEFNPRYWTPLKQFMSVIPIDEIQCKEEMVLITKSSDGSPACVKPSTTEKLIARGWGVMPEQNTVEPITDVPDIITATDVVDANNQFTFNVYSKISQQSNDNIFFSPLSISTAFAIAYEGAGGNTAQEIQNTFGFIENDEKRRSSFQNIMEKSNEKNSEYKFNIANALWLAEGFEPYSGYVSDIKTHYDSEVSTVNFAADATNTINNWVSDKTEEKIKVLFDPGSLEPGTRLVITNAIYFNGSWTFPFDERDTRQDEFITSSEETVQVQMMHQTAYFDYYQDEQLQLVELPYRGDKMSMLILLPTSVDGIDSLEDSLTAENIAKWQNGLENKKITVEIPKFILETGYDLIKILEAMGIHDAFGSSADFGGISDEDLFIYKAIHKAVVDVNEVGTEAAAATGIAMLDSGPFATVRADHPFVFLIQDNENQNILFIGKVVDPSQ